MNYKRRRMNSGLTVAYVSAKLGLNVADYKLVEEGRKGLSSDKIEIFSDLVNNLNQSKLEEMQMIEEAKKWFFEVNIDEEIEKFGYSRGTFGEASGMSRTKICDYANKKKYVDSGILEFYIFLHNENNRCYNTKKKEEKQAISDPRFTSVEILNNTEKSEHVETSFVMVSPNQIEEYKKTIEDLNYQITILQAERNKIYGEMKIYKIRSEAYEKILLENNN